VLTVGGDGVEGAGRQMIGSNTELVTLTRPTGASPNHPLDVCCGRCGRESSRSIRPSRASSTHSPAGWSCASQRILPLTAASWHNDHSGQPTARSLIAYDHRHRSAAPCDRPTHGVKPDRATSGPVEAWVGQRAAPARTPHKAARAVLVGEAVAKRSVDFFLDEGSELAKGLENITDDLVVLDLDAEAVLKRDEELYDCE
jgi:hypothetical protein